MPGWGMAGRVVAPDTALLPARSAGPPGWTPGIAGAGCRWSEHLIYGPPPFSIPRPALRFPDASAQVSLPVELLVAGLTALASFTIVVLTGLLVRRLYARRAVPVEAQAMSEPPTAEDPDSLSGWPREDGEAFVTKATDTGDHASGGVPDPGSWPPITLRRAPPPPAEHPAASAAPATAELGYRTDDGGPAAAFAAAEQAAHRDARRAIDAELMHLPSLGPHPVSKAHSPALAGGPVEPPMTTLRSTAGSVLTAAAVAGGAAFGAALGATVGAAIALSVLLRVLPGGTL